MRLGYCWLDTDLDAFDKIKTFCYRWLDLHLFGYCWLDSIFNLLLLWCFTSTETIRLIREGRTEVREIIYLSLHCHHKNDSSLRWAAMRAILKFHKLWGTKSQGSVHKSQPFWREWTAEPESSRSPFAYQPNALPPGQTGSRLDPDNDDVGLKVLSLGWLLLTGFRLCWLLLTGFRWWWTDA